MGLACHGTQPRSQVPGSRVLGSLPRALSLGPAPWRPLPVRALGATAPGGAVRTGHLVAARGTPGSTDVL